jgi:REP element-mobilizing transposase RayT
MKYNTNLQERHSFRLKGYDYSQVGLYFVTICVQNWECLFGKIENGEMIGNDKGKIAIQCWLEIPQHFPNTVLRSVWQRNYYEHIIRDEQSYQKHFQLYHQ